MKNDLTQEQLQQPVTVTLPLGVLLGITGEGAAPPALESASFGGLPSIGAAYSGGVYAGLSLDQGRPVALILLPDDLAPTNWKDAGAWAEKNGGTLPSRIDLLVLFKNLKSEFQESWYWSSEQLASDASYAWMQSFGYGHQHYHHQSIEFRARAVRRLIIQ